MPKPKLFTEIGQPECDGGRIVSKADFATPATSPVSGWARRSVPGDRLGPIVWRTPSHRKAVLQACPNQPPISTTKTEVPPNDYRGAPGGGWVGLPIGMT